MQDDFFLKKMKGVKPFKKDRLIKIDPNINKKNVKIEKSKQISNQIKEAEKMLKKNVPEFELSFGDINKDLKKGRIKIDRKLDLHGFNLVDAHTKFKVEIIKAYNNNKRCLLVITGKGAHINKQHKEQSDSHKPKLFYGKIKNAITTWIKESNLKNYILTYQDAGIEHGGDGAIFIYLRKKRT